MRLGDLSVSDLKEMLYGVRKKESKLPKLILLVLAVAAVLAAVGGIIYFIARRREDDELFDDECDGVYCYDEDDDECDCECERDYRQDKRIARVEQKIKKHEEKASQLREQLDAVTAVENIEDDYNEDID